MRVLLTGSLLVLLVSGLFAQPYDIGKNSARLVNQKTPVTASSFESLVRKPIHDFPQELLPKDIILMWMGVQEETDGSVNILLVGQNRGGEYFLFSRIPVDYEFSAEMFFPLFMEGDVLVCTARNQYTAVCAHYAWQDGGVTFRSVEIYSEVVSDDSLDTAYQETEPDLQNETGMDVKPPVTEPEIVKEEKPVVQENLSSVALPYEVTFTGKGKVLDMKKGEHGTYIDKPVWQTTGENPELLRDWKAKYATAFRLGSSVSLTGGNKGVLLEMNCDFTSQGGVKTDYVYLFITDAAGKFLNAVMVYEGNPGERPNVTSTLLNDALLELNKFGYKQKYKISPAGKLSFTI